MNNDLPVLSDAVVRALKTEASRPAPSAAVLAQASRRLQTSLEAAALGGTLSPSGFFSAGLAKLAVVFALGVGVGGVGGITLYASRRPSSSFTAPSEPERSRLPSTTAAPSGLDAPDERRPETASPAAPPAAVPPHEEPAKTLGKIPTPTTSSAQAERLLIERATIALGRGEAQAALTACDEHQRRFKQGLFIEERESLAIRALLGLGRDAEAQRRAAAFHQRFPDSMQRAVIDDSFRNGPQK